MLNDAGFDVVTAASADEALDAAVIRPPQAAILDLLLPDRDGVEVARSLREWSDMPIVMLSAVWDEGEKVRALNAGADDYVTKPFGPDSSSRGYARCCVVQEVPPKSPPSSSAIWSSTR